MSLRLSINLIKLRLLQWRRLHKLLNQYFLSTDRLQELIESTWKSTLWVASQRCAAC